MSILDATECQVGRLFGQLAVRLEPFLAADTGAWAGKECGKVAVLQMATLKMISFWSDKDPKKVKDEQKRRGKGKREMTTCAPSAAVWV